MQHSYVSHLECGLDGEHHPADVLQSVSRAGKPLLVRYDLDAVRRALPRAALAARPRTLWRYRELLPLPFDREPLSLGEDMTPLVALPALAHELGLGSLWAKDEGRLPTGSFKARGLALAVNMAQHFGVRAMAIPTNGNAGAAMAAYCVRAGIEAHCFAPADTPEANLREMELTGATLTRVAGMIDDCGKLVAAGEKEGRWMSCATLREPYRIEGKKTMGLELAEQLDWQLPDAIFYPTGGGTGLIGMWKAFDEMQALGWIDARRPRMYAIQASGCAPIVRAFDEGAEFARRWEDAHTIAHGIRVPAALGDFLILRAVRESGGAALAVDDVEILRAWRDSGRRDGFLMCPEGAATLAGLRLAVERRLVVPGERVLLFNCATPYKYTLPELESPVAARR
jgi:threonine synthase